MKKRFAIALFFCLPLCLPAQVVFKTIVPPEKITVGSSFRVQFVIEGAQKVDGFKTTGFPDFRVVAGPSLYMGSAATLLGEKPVRNIVYTLEAIRPGHFLIQGASALIDQKPWTSNNAPITIISKQEAEAKEKAAKKYSANDYYLQLGEDPYQKIKNNLFVRIEVDKKNCFMGEPILVTYKLYSCLQSRSDIIKNPGFYGFSVFDMISLADKVQTTQKIHGKLFDVHTIRQLQLFPLRAGQFTIDAMKIKNSVAFSRSLVHKKTEQEIIEGMYGQQPISRPSDAVYYENEIETSPVTINVKPLPGTNKPVSFSGAVGKFFLASSLEKKTLAKGEQSFLKIMVSGAGNFIQLTAPTVQWPEGIEAFAPTIEDHFEKTAMPLSGSRTFVFPFVATQEGAIQLPAVSLSYFDIDSNLYQTISTPSMTVAVKGKLPSAKTKLIRQPSIEALNKRSGQLAAIIVSVLAGMVLLYWIFRKKEGPTDATSATVPRKDAAALLQPAATKIHRHGPSFFMSLYHVLWQYLAEKFQLEGTAINKNKLLETARLKKMPEDILQKMIQVLTICETAQFTEVPLAENREALLQTANDIITALEKHYSEYL